MRLTPSQAAKLARLAVGESLPKSELPPALLRSLQDTHAVRLEKSGASYIVRGIPGKLARVVEQIWGVRDLQEYATATPVVRNRALLTNVAGDSKVLPTSPMDGIFIRTFGGCFLGDQPLGSTPWGSTLLISLNRLPELRIETKCLIGIEGVECLWKFEDARKHFPQLDGRDYALVLRWHWRDAWRQWLRDWDGTFFHFPDYDPAGLKIFTTEILPYRPDARLLIPSNLDSLIDQRGSRDLFLRQETLLPLHTQHAETAQACKILQKFRKALEHEMLLSL